MNPLAVLGLLGSLFEQVATLAEQLAKANARIAELESKQAE